MTNDDIKKLVHETLEKYKEQRSASLYVGNTEQLEVAYHLLDRALLLDEALLKPLLPEGTLITHTKSKSGSYTIHLEII